MYEKYENNVNTACYCEEVPVPCRTIKDNICEITDMLMSAEGTVDRIRKGLWYRDGANNPEKDIEVVDMDTAIAHVLEIAHRIAKKTEDLANRVGI